MNVRFPSRLSFAATVVCACALASTLVASPSDDITKAVKAAGAARAKTAEPAQFLRGLSTVILRIKDDQIVDVVAAAVDLRPELAPQIVSTVVRDVVAKHRAKHQEELPCKLVEEIVRTAVRVDPKRAAEVVRAALLYAPWDRECILAAALHEAPGERVAIQNAASETPGASASLFPAFPAGGFEGLIVGTINPANLAPTGDEEPVSPEAPPVRTGRR